MERNWRRARITPDATMWEAMGTLASGAALIALVVDEDDRLVGTVTDGDVRRGILAGIDPKSCLVTEIMSQSPIACDDKASRLEQLNLMRRHYVRELPIVDDVGRVVAIVHVHDLLGEVAAVRHNVVVIMAGGLGTRLGALTAKTPKPLLKVGPKPLLETILTNFIEQGFAHFVFAVGYRAEMIEDYFGDGSRWGVDIEYVREDKRLGTAGALGLMQIPLSGPIIVMNGDLMTRIDFGALLNYHLQEGVGATMCVREFHVEVPFGVVSVVDRRIIEIKEKPSQRMLVNAGIYVLDPVVVDLVPTGQAYDMTELFDRVVALGHGAAAFPVQGYWLDVGREADFEQANQEFHGVFDK